MKSKALKPQTIIPQSLYAYRAADRQLREVIEDMGRPGYILVARQMGKTNLLLNAKRELEGESTVFAYIDLSNKFDTLRECFRNIIDTTIDANFSKFGSARKAIDQAHRAVEESLPPHKEHEQELLFLLREHPGKLIVILDEIDALGNVEFSDQLFAQIRSIYFSRVNFPEFNRLTYVLSGVAEPSEIIKNKNISPFNIGEKIYLDDFTSDEYSTFVEKARLELSKEAKDRIYHWAGGNPRLTWDICSAIEDLIISGAEISAESVDLVVKKLYLNSFDRPPVDHIRKLCEDNREIRQAIINIRCGQHSELTDALRKRLYLAGAIQSSEFSSEVVSIKNRIIDAALGVEWLADIDKKSIGLRRLGDEKYEIGAYHEAAKFYEEYLNQATSNISAITRYRAATSFYALKRFEEAILNYDRVISDDSSEGIGFLAHALHFVSLCHLALQNYNAATETLNRLKDISSEYLAPTLVNLAATYARIDLDANSQKIIELSQELIESLDQGKIPQTPQLFGTAHWNIAEAYLAKGDYDNANDSYQKALKTSPESWRPAICLRILGLDQDLETKRSLVTTAIDELIDNKLDFSGSSEQEQLALNQRTIDHLLLTALAFDLDSKFDELSNYKIQHLCPGLSKTKLRQDLAEEASTEGQPLLARKLLTAVDDPRQLPTAGLRLVLGASEPYEFGPFESAYLQRLEDEGSVELIDKFTFYWLASRTSYAHRTKNLQMAGRLLACAEGLRHKVHPDLSVNYLAIDYVGMNVYLATNKWKLASDLARNIVAQLPQKDEPLTTNAFFSLADLAEIEKQATAIVKAFPDTFIEPFIRGRKYGKNEHVTVTYKNGKTIRAKYKKVQSEIEQGLCDITESDMPLEAAEPHAPLNN